MRKLRKLISYSKMEMRSWTLNLSLKRESDAQAARLLTKIYFAIYNKVVVGSQALNYLVKGFKSSRKTHLQKRYEKNKMSGKRNL